MWNTFKYTILELVRMPGVLVWALAFPLILSTVFMMMFGPLDDQSEIDPIPLVAVDPADDVEGQSFQAFLDALSDDGNGESLFAITYVPNAEEAVDLVERNMAEENPYVGYVQLLEGTPDVHVTSVSDLTGMEWLKTSILVMAMDNYVANAAMIRDLMNGNPGLVAQPDMAETLASMTKPIEATVRTTVTANQPKESVRFYFALLGMAALFGGTLGMIAFQRLKPNTSPLGARRALGATSHGRTVAATVAASWTITFACLCATYLYMRYVAGIDFGGRDGACLITTAIAALTATALGCAISAIPKVPESGKSGILTGIVCFASLFAGLYGEPTMELADMVSANFPVLDYVNPAVQISQAFYSIMYYDSLAPMVGHLVVLLVMALVLFALSAQSLRRQRYASL